MLKKNEHSFLTEGWALSQKYANFFNLSRPDPGRREKINLNFSFHTTLWWLKRFYKGPKGPKGRNNPKVTFSL